ncbi:MAG: class I lanthipeptide [Bacteroidales bacterium]
MEKKSLNKKLQLNKETIAELSKDEQSQILGGRAVHDYAYTVWGVDLYKDIYSESPECIKMRFKVTLMTEYNACPDTRIAFECDGVKSVMQGETCWM